jgi:hypothetical protein
MDWINSLFGFANSSDLNGSSAPNSSPLPLSTPVDSSGGNTNTSGNWFSSLVSSLSGAGTSAASAYNSIFGTKSQPAQASGTKPATQTFSISSTVILMGAAAAGVLLLLFVLLRKK